jgi:hypothetical protein
MSEPNDQSRLNQASFEGWARVEVMGHQTPIGYVTTQAFGQAVMFRVDQPAVDGTEETLARPEWVGEVYAQPGSIVKRADIPACTVLIGSGSIYRIIPCDEPAAMKAIRSSQFRPLMTVKLIESRPQLPAQIDDERPHIDDDELPF